MAALAPAATVGSVLAAGGADRNDLQVLLAHTIGVTRTKLLSNPQAPIDPAQLARFESAHLRLQAGEPLPYLIGEWEFFGASFAVSPAVLIPRPETELLVEQALQLLQPGARVADVGTGSGCIAVALALHNRSITLTASDAAVAALQVARANAQRHAVSTRIQFVHTHLLRALGEFDLICANLPYLTTQEAAELAVGRHEPRLALDGGADGLQLIAELLATAPAHLAAGGAMCLEIGAAQKAAVCGLAAAAFPAARVQVLPDLAGHDRLLVIQDSP
ncbi:MAG: peptide chain release factor N(5)-glutamine methyltransferase [Chloroflexi bacterium]|nr:peptide chain release factor N(5)-glutamine methyltransferase [Chloroflexota bacterium]MQC24523.1 peptide chain release factor N(5)-glutamine methyltransferase [Chloroflexota bacterium]